MKYIFKTIFAILFLLTLLFYSDRIAFSSTHSFFEDSLKVKEMTGWALSGKMDYSSWCMNYSGFKIKFQNIGTRPVNHIKFRLKIFRKSSNQTEYSRVHTIDISIDPQDIATSDEFDLDEPVPVCNNDTSWEFWDVYYWNIEYVKVW